MKDDKELSDLDVCIEIEKLKGFTLVYSDNLGDYSIGTPYAKDDRRFDPITDNALNLELRDEFEVVVDYNNLEVICYKSKSAFMTTTNFTDKSQINRAVCLCILEGVK